MKNTIINQELSILSTAIKWCNSQLDWNLPNPLAGKRLPEEIEEARCLSVDEMRKLVQSAQQCRSKHTRNYFTEFCILGFNTMTRSGELLNLEWKRVNLVDKTVESRVEDTKGRQRRLVALNQVAYEALLRLRRVADANFPETLWVFTHTRPRSFGARIKSVRKVWETAVLRAKIEWCTPHTLRHTGITDAVHAKHADVVDVSRLVGHKNLKTTIGYIHVADERLHKSVVQMPKLATV